MKSVMILFIKIYQWTIAPLLGNCCRFYPTCSNYAVESFQKKGFFKGTFYTFRRVLRCHPWHPGGYDPVGKDEG